IEWTGGDEPVGLSARLQNRGGDPFLFYDFETAPEGTRAEIRIAARDPGAPEIGPGLPVRLVGQEPMRAANPPQLAPSSEGLAELPPGQSVTVSLPPAEVGERPPAAPAGAELSCLVRGCFPRTSLDGEPFVQEA